MLNFNDHPGMYFVTAALLPLASFFLILLWCGATALLRRYHRWERIESAVAFLEGPVAPLIPAGLALLGIGLAFLLGLAGFLTLNGEQWLLEREVRASEWRIRSAEARLRALPGERVLAREKIDEAKKAEEKAEEDRKQKADEAGAEADEDKKKKADEALKKAEEEKKKATEAVQKAEAKLEALKREDPEHERTIPREREHIEHLARRAEAQKAKWKASVAWLTLYSGLTEGKARLERDEDRLRRLPEEIRRARERVRTSRPDKAEEVGKAVREVAQLKEEQTRLESATARLRAQLAGRLDPDRATTFRLGYFIDNLSALLFAMVAFLALLIHVYSLGYLSSERGTHPVEDHEAEDGEEPPHRRGRFARFFLFLSLFSFAMLEVVLADNLLQVFVGWELMGACSYLLIGFYFERSRAANAATKAFLTNRVGDVGFLVALAILWAYLGTFTFEEMFAQVRSPQKDADGEALARSGQMVRGEWREGRRGERQVEVGEPGQGGALVLFPARPLLDPEQSGHFHGVDTNSRVVIDAKPGVKKYGAMPYWLLVVAGLGLFLGCAGKSAQFPLHSWLPDAMEGPTPVSALIHAATMVAAGVYLVGRCYPLLTPEVLLVIAYTGAITLAVAATTAMVVTDLKRVLAYSTVSQLGYMMLALGVGGWAPALFHLVTHAFAKGLLFLGAGSVIHACRHEQEMTRMGGLGDRLPITSWTMLVGVMALAGVPGLSGWYSKDAILGQTADFARAHPEHAVLFALPLLTVGLTAFYLFRLWFMTFKGEPGSTEMHDQAREPEGEMTLPLIILAVLTVCIGWGWPFLSFWPPFLDPTSSALEHNLARSQPTFLAPEAGGWWDHRIAGWLALALTGVGFGVAYLIYEKRLLSAQGVADRFPTFHRFLAHRWYVDEFIDAAVVRPTVAFARLLRPVDGAALDRVVNAVGRAALAVGRVDRRFDNRVVDGSVNLVGAAVAAVGVRLRFLQTGALRTYVLCLVLAATGLFVALAYFVTLTSAR